MSDAGCYLYAVSRGVATSDLTPISGLRGAELRVISHRGLDAVVSAVDLDEFGEEGLRRNLENMQWLEEIARGHDDVVREVAAIATVAPVRMATICRTDDSVRTRLDQWHDDLVQALDRVVGRQEWSVKAYAAEDAVSEPAAAEPATTGAAYLQRRRASLAQARQSAEDATAVADQVHHELAAASVASRLLQPQDRRLSGHPGVMTLNAAYLLDEGSANRFRALVDDMAAKFPTAQIELRGPWPPYSFATLDTP